MPYPNNTPEVTRAAEVLLGISFKGASTNQHRRLTEVEDALQALFDAAAENGARDAAFVGGLDDA